MFLGSAIPALDTSQRSLSTPFGGISPWPSTGRRTTMSRRERSCLVTKSNCTNKASASKPSTEWERILPLNPCIHWPRGLLPKRSGASRRLSHGYTCCTGWRRPWKPISSCTIAPTSSSLLLDPADRSNPSIPALVYRAC